MLRLIWTHDLLQSVHDEFLNHTSSESFRGSLFQMLWSILSMWHFVFHESTSSFRIPLHIFLPTWQCFRFENRKLSSDLCEELLSLFLFWGIWLIQTFYPFYPQNSPLYIRVTQYFKLAVSFNPYLGIWMYIGLEKLHYETIFTTSLN
jgi:hypothetical protein